MKTSRTPVTIVGTGLSGLFAAAMLARHGIQSALVGPAPRPDSDVRTTAILQPGIKWLHDAGLWQDCIASATPLMVMELRNGHQVTTFDASTLGENTFGYNVSNAALKKVLWHFITRQKNMTHYDHLASAVAATDKGWRVTCGRTPIDTDLLIGADGRHSLVRQAAQIQIAEKPEQQAALVVNMGIDKPHHFTSVEWYFPGGPFTTVPLPGNQLALVWCDDEALVDERMKLSPQALAESITQITAKRFGSVRVTGPVQKWPIRPMHAKRLVAPHLALIGEAAHVLPPIGAQGFNTSLQDIFALEKQLLRAQKLGLRYDDPGLLAAFETARLKDIRLRYESVNRLNDIIRTTHPLGRLARHAGLAVASRFTLVKTPLMRWGMGHSLTGTQA